MTKKQLQQFVKMYSTLRKIAKDYQTPEQLERNSKKQYGLGYLESIGMAYENIQSEAAHAIKGIRVNDIAKQLNPQH
jgi:hypothetical protein